MYSHIIYSLQMLALAHQQTSATEVGVGLENQQMLLCQIFGWMHVLFQFEAIAWGIKYYSVL